MVEHNTTPAGEDAAMRIVLWGVAWRPAAGGSWDILHADMRPVVFSDPRLADRRVRVEAERNPAFLYQALPLESKCLTCGGEGWIVEVESAHDCDGTEKECLANCPVPVQVQVACPGCNAAEPKPTTADCAGEPF